MKNKFLNTVFAILTLSTVISCSEDYLEKSPTSFINLDDTGASGELNSAVLDATLNGIYSMMINTGTGGTTRHEDFGQKGYDIMTDFLSGDMALTANNYNRYGAFVNLLSTIDYTSNFNYMPWRYYYRVIRSTNLVIKSLGGTDVIPDTDNGKYTMGQAKALRAYAYFYLTQLFAAEYDATAEVLPVYRDSEDDIQPLSNMEVIFDFMVDDLTTAIDYLDGFSRSNKTSVNQDVAKGLLAYVYAARGTSSDNLNAKSLADEVIDAGYSLMTSAEATGGFNDVTTSGWIWGFDITLANGLDLISWWGQVDVFTYSYQWAGDRKGIDQGLYDAISVNDIRKTQFDESNSLQPRNKFYNDAKVIGGQRNIEDDYVYMRVAEMYLLSAEMAAKEGQETEAKDRLKEVLSERFSDAADYAYIDGLSGQALDDEIYLQTKIELWGEGKSYLAMKRNKATITRGSNHVFHAGSSFSYDSEELNFQIPQSEVQNNPFIQ